MGWSSGGTQKAKALQDAAAFCERMGKDFEVIKESETAGGFGKIASAQVEFRCVDRGTVVPK